MQLEKTVDKNLYIRLQLRAMKSKVLLIYLVFFLILIEYLPAQQTVAKCDTLILRENCDYCLGERSTYQPRKFSPTTTCICYAGKTGIKDVNKYIQNHKGEIKSVTIENPSHIIFDLNLGKLKKLQMLDIFGADKDAIKILPEELLSLPSLQRIIFTNVQFPKSELDRLRIKFPRVVFEGKIEEYQEQWDQSRKF